MYVKSYDIQPKDAQFPFKSACKETIYGVVCAPSSKALVFLRLSGVGWFYVSCFPPPPPPSSPPVLAPDLNSVFRFQQSYPLVPLARKEFQKERQNVRQKPMLQYRCDHSKQSNSTSMTPAKNTAVCSVLLIGTPKIIKNLNQSQLLLIVLPFSAGICSFLSTWVCDGLHICLDTIWGTDDMMLPHTRFSQPIYRSMMNYGQVYGILWWMNVFKYINHFPISNVDTTHIPPLCLVATGVLDFRVFGCDIM